MSVNRLMSASIGKIGDLVTPVETTIVRLWDENWDLRFELDGPGWRADEPGIVVLPINHPVAVWIIDQIEDRDVTINLTADFGIGNRWSGCLQSWKVFKADGRVYLKAEFLGDVGTVRIFP